MSLSAPILSSIYSGLWELAKPFLRRHKRLKKGFEERLVPDAWPYQNLQAPIVWIQAASGGEARLIAPILQELSHLLGKKNSPTPQFLCTSCTEQGLDIINQTMRDKSLKIKDNKIEVSNPDKNSEQNISLANKNIEDGKSTNSSNAVRHEFIPSQSEKSIPIVPAFFPLDSPKIMSRALKQSKAELLILLETELWPGLMHEVKKAGIPYIILNARMTESTYKYYRLGRSFFKKHKPLAILATSPESQERFSDIFQMEVDFMENIKFDIALKSLKSANKKEAEERENEPVPTNSLARQILKAQDDIILSLASVREEEEDDLLILLEYLTNFIESDNSSLNLSPKNFHIIIAPRHLHRVENWQKLLNNAGINYQLRSTLTPNDCKKLLNPSLTAEKTSSCCVEETNKGAKKTREKLLEHGSKTAQKSSPKSTIGKFYLTIWDTFGELELVYQASDIVFVGGSLAPLGGQNFLEALAFGIKPYIGPSYFNFDWTASELFELNLVHRAENSDELKKLLVAELLRVSRTELNIISQEKEYVRKSLENFLITKAQGAHKSASLLVNLLTKHIERGI